MTVSRLFAVTCLALVPNFASAATFIQNALACQEAIKGPDHTIMRLDDKLVINDSSLQANSYLVYSDKGVHSFIYPVTKQDSITVEPIGLHFSKPVFFDEEHNAHVVADQAKSAIVKAEIVTRYDKNLMLLNLMLEGLEKAEERFNLNLGIAGINNFSFGVMVRPGPVIDLANASYGFFTFEGALSPEDQVLVDRAVRLGLVKSGATSREVRSALLFENVVARALMGQLTMPEVDKIVQVYGYMSAPAKLAKVKELEKQIEQLKTQVVSPDDQVAKDEKVRLLEVELDDTRFMMPWKYSSSEVLRKIRETVPRREVLEKANAFKDGLEACGKLGYHPVSKLAQEMARKRPIPR